MKIEELQIGDWYWWEAEGKKYPLQVTKETFSLKDHDIANFQPIPITDEILEKNGFKSQHYDNDYRMYKLDDIHVSNRFWNWKEEDRWDFDITAQYEGTISFCRIKYVHELQNILSSLKIINCVDFKI